MYTTNCTIPRQLTVAWLKHLLDYHNMASRCSALLQPQQSGRANAGPGNGSPVVKGLSGSGRAQRADHAGGCPAATLSASGSLDEYGRWAELPVYAVQLRLSLLVPMWLAKGLVIKGMRISLTRQASVLTYNFSFRTVVPS